MREKSTHQKSLKNNHSLLNRFIKKIPQEVFYIIILFLITRSFLTLTGIFSRNYLHLAYDYWYVWQYDNHKWLDIWSVWDSGWYLDIAQNGYSPTLKSDIPQKTCCGQSNVVFYPLYPVSIRFLGGIINNYYLAGIIISNASFLIASLFFYKLVAETFNKEVALKSTLILYLFPTSYFFSTVLTEGLFLLTSVLTFYFAYKKKWFTASVFGFLSSLTKSIGVLIIIPVLISYFLDKYKNKKKLDYKILYFILILVAPMLFMLYIHHISGNPLYSFVVEKNSWNHGFVNPVSYLLEYIFHSNLVMAYFGVLVLSEIILVIFKARRIGLMLTVYSLIFLITPLFSGGETILALPRFSSTAFPVYIALALSIKSKVKLTIVLTFLFSMQITSMFLWNIGLFGY